MVVILNHIIVLMAYANLQNVNVIMRGSEERDIVVDVAELGEIWILLKREYVNFQNGRSTTLKICNAKLDVYRMNMMI
jgi:hypothetical protein